MRAVHGSEAGACRAARDCAGQRPAEPIGRTRMKVFLLTTACAISVSGAAMAENIGVSMALFDDNFLTVLRNGMQEHAASLDGVTIQIDDAQNDVGKQLNQIENFVASGVDAIIVNPVDTDATVAMSAAAQNAGI